MLFEDNFDVTGVNPDGKKFDKGQQDDTSDNRDVDGRHLGNSHEWQADFILISLVLFSEPFDLQQRQRSGHGPGHQLPTLQARAG